MAPDSPRPAHHHEARAAGRAGVSGEACTLGIDLGTSSAKAVIIGAGGTVLAQASAAYTVTSARAGYAESEPEHWWNAVTACTREAVQAAGARPAAIGLSGQMHGLVMVSREGRALRPALLWADSRATGSLRAYQALGAPALARLANPLAPGMAGPMLTWIAEHEPRTYASARWALQPKDWIRARLTGEFHAEPSDASATLLYDLMGDGWDLEVVRALGLDATMLAPLLPSAGALAGHLTAAAGAELGLPAGVPVAAGAADTAASALGSGVVSNRHAGGGEASGGDVQLTIGTGAQVIKALDVPASRAEAGIHLYRAATRGLVPDGRQHQRRAQPQLGAGDHERHLGGAVRERRAPGPGGRPDLRPAPVGGTDAVRRSGAPRFLDRVVAGG